MSAANPIGADEGAEPESVPSTRPHQPGRTEGGQDHERHVGADDGGAPQPEPQRDQATHAVREQAGGAVGGQAEHGHHPGLLADARGPEHQCRQEEEEEVVAAVVGVGQSDADRPAEEDQAQEGDPGEEDETGELTAGEDGVRQAAEDLDEAASRDLAEHIAAVLELVGELEPDVVVAGGVAQPLVHVVEHRVPHVGPDHLGHERGQEQGGEARVLVEAAEHDGDGNGEGQEHGDRDQGAELLGVEVTQPLRPDQQHDPDDDEPHHRRQRRPTGGRSAGELVHGRGGE